MQSQEEPGRIDQLSCALCQVESTMLDDSSNTSHLVDELFLR